MEWQLQQAEGHLGEIVERAHREGPQFVAVEGETSAVVLSIEEYRKLKGPPKTLKDLIFDGPTLSDDIVDLINERSHDSNRDLEL